MVIPDMLLIPFFSCLVRSSSHDLLLRATILIVSRWFRRNFQSLSYAVSPFSSQYQSSLTSSFFFPFPTVSSTRSQSTTTLSTGSISLSPSISPNKPQWSDRSFTVFYFLYHLLPFIEDQIDSALNVSSTYYSFPCRCFSSPPLSSYI